MIDKINIRNREFLQMLRECALAEAKTENLNESWKRVYLRLADAVDGLDAYIARCTTLAEYEKEVLK